MLADLNFLNPDKTLRLQVSSSSPDIIFLQHRIYCTTGILDEDVWRTYYALTRNEVSDFHDMLKLQSVLLNKDMWENDYHVRIRAQLKDVVYRDEQGRPLSVFRQVLCVKVYLAPPGMDIANAIRLTLTEYMMASVEDLLPFVRE